MSGGAYNYRYSVIDQLAGEIRDVGSCHCASPASRRAFKRLLQEIAGACRAIEWNDSGDGDPHEVELLEAVLGRERLIMQAVEDAHAARKELDRVLAAYPPPEAP